MRMLSSLVVVVVMTLGASAQDPAPKPGADSDSKLDSLQARLAELQAEVDRLKAERGQPATKESQEKAPEVKMEPLEPPAPADANGKGTGFHCQSCGGSFFLSADAQGQLAELGDWVFCPACGMACWVRKAGVPEEANDGKVGRIKLRRVRVPDPPSGG